MHLDSSSSGAVGIEDNLTTVVSHEQVQVGTVANGLVVCCSSRRSFACDAADCLSGPDEAGVVAVCAITGVCSVQIRDPGLRFES